jgi:glycosyltransferase involved in cell wall biosynthesis
MRILHLDTGREMRGGQWQALFLIEGLRDAGHDCVLLAPAGSPLAAKASERGLVVRDLSVAALTRNAGGADLLHAHDARAHTFGLTMCRLPLVVSRRVAFPVQNRAASRWKYSRAQHFIAISNYVRERLREAEVPEEKISVVYDGVPVPPSSAVGEKILAASTDDPRKGPALVREAARLAGVDVQFSSDLPGDLRGARLFLYFSDEEGLGSAALLASAHGVPVIASNVGGLKEAVEHEETGLLSENNSMAAASCIRRVLDDPALGHAMGIRGRERVMRQFTVDAMVRGTLAAYERLIG